MTYRTILVVLLIFSFRVHSIAQEVTYDTLRQGKVLLRFPHTWHPLKEIRDNFTRITLTPDSLNDLKMKAFELIEFDMHGNSFEEFKEDFLYTIRSRAKDVKIWIVKKQDIVFKGRKTVYAEVTIGPIPEKVYGIDGGKMLYLISLLGRDINGAPDKRLEQDEKAILQSMIIDK